MKYKTLLLILLVNLKSFAQQIDTFAVKSIAKATPNSVMVRWAPVGSKYWLLGNKQGYVIERVLLAKDGKLLPRANSQILNSTPLKPLPEESWEAFIKTDKFAPVAAQALYGKNFVLNGNKGDLVSLINASKEQDNRYSFALFAADMSWKIAESSGLAWEDKTVLKGERYLYKIYPKMAANTVNSKNKMVIDTAYAYMGVDDYAPTPRVTRLQGDFKDQMVVLKWNQAIYNQFFTAYIIERSDDGKKFVPTSEVPFLNPRTSTKIGDGMIYKGDSLPQNEKIYYFRVRGITPFGETSQPSDTISGQGYIPLSGNPSITDGISTDNKKVTLFWTFPETEIAQVQGFQVEKSETIEGVYKTITPKMLPKTQKEYVDVPTQNSTYYRIKALGKKNGEYAHSFPYFVQLVDSLPPAYPIKVTGKIDSLGIVRIDWQANTEPDLYGYRVYRSNSLDEEFSQVTKEAITQNKFTDTIQLNTLTKKIYYHIIAVDTRFNPSKFAPQALELKRPDIVPPGPAVFTEAKSTLKGAELKWEKSAAEDLEKQVLYRKDEKTKEWAVIASFDAKIQQYTDPSGEKGVLYSYTLVSVDDSKLESVPSRPVQARKFDSKERPKIEKLTAQTEPERKRVILNWKYVESQDIERFIIYKAKGEEKISQLGFTLNTPNRQYMDEQDLKIGNIYHYRIKAVYKDGTESPISETVNVIW